MKLRRSARASEFDVSSPLEFATDLAFYLQIHWNLLFIAFQTNSLSQNQDIQNARFFQTETVLSLFGNVESLHLGHRKSLLAPDVADCFWVTPVNHPHRWS